MKSQTTMIESKSPRGLHDARRSALSGPGKLMVAAAVLFSLLTIPLLTRADDPNGQEQNDKRTLTGNWMVTVTPVTLPPAQPVPFQTLMTYFEDANLLQESSSNTVRSTGRGNWQRTGHGRFTQSIIFFRFDTARNYLGTRVITSTIVLSEDGRQYQADSIGQNFDASGNLVSTSGATEIANRLF